ncbi:MAG: FMN-binding protein [Saprospirales bacterium]|nr:FMN-binding protein [Saprospirales bacterium]
MRTHLLFTAMGLFLCFSSIGQPLLPSPQKDELVTALSRRYPGITLQNLEKELIPYALIKGKPKELKRFADFDKKLHKQFREQTIKKVPFWKLKNHPSIDVLYMEGNGHYGPIWGYLVMDEIDKTIVDVCFFHRAETRTYGADITLDWFQGQFAGMKLSADGQLLQLEMPDRESYTFGGVRLDAISGATQTNRGLMDMYNGMLRNYSALLTGKTEL